jgi:hypothetical protein
VPAFAGRGCGGMCTVAVKIRQRQKSPGAILHSMGQFLPCHSVRGMSANTQIAAQ